MRTLSKIIIACAISICTLSSCKKSNVSPKLSLESIAFTINGTKHTLTSNVSEHKVIYNLAFYTTTISASSSQNNERMSLVVLYNRDSLKIGTYTLSNAPDLNSGNITFTYDSDNGYSYVIQDFTYPNDKITITEMGADYIKGTFSAKLSAILPSGSQPVSDITITNGEFYAKTAPAN
jgi:hypothetical protein